MWTSFAAGGLGAVCAVLLGYVLRWAFEVSGLKHVWALANVYWQARRVRARATGRVHDWRRRAVGLVGVFADRSKEAVDYIRAAQPRTRPNPFDPAADTSRESDARGSGDHPDEEHLARAELSRMGVDPGDAFVYVFTGAVAMKFALWLVRRGFIKKEALNGIDEALDRLTVITDVGLVWTLLFGISAAPVRALVLAIKALKLSSRVDAVNNTREAARAGMGHPTATGWSTDEDLGWLAMFPRLIREHRWLIVVACALIIMAVLRAYRNMLERQIEEEVLSRAGNPALSVGEASGQGVMPPKPDERPPSGSGVDPSRRRRAIKNVSELLKEGITVAEKRQDIPPFKADTGCAIPLHNASGTVVGWAAHVKLGGANRVVSVQHVVDEQVYWDKAGKKAVKTAAVHRQFPEYTDALVILDVTGAGIALPKAWEAVKFREINPGLIQCGSYTSVGIVALLDNLVEGPVLVHLCSTDGGWSGCPVYVIMDGRWTLVGLHGGAFTDKPGNYALPFFA